MSENHCVSCGAIIPEGRQTCRKCIEEYMKQQAQREFRAVATKKDGTQMFNYGKIAELTKWADVIMGTGDYKEIQIKGA